MTDQQPPRADVPRCDCCGLPLQGGGCPVRVYGYESNQHLKSTIKDLALRVRELEERNVALADEVAAWGAMAAEDLKERGFLVEVKDK